MVVQVLADALQVSNRIDPDRAEMIAITDARQHEQLRRLEGAAAADDLASGVSLCGLTFLVIFHPGDAR